MQALSTAPTSHRQSESISAAKVDLRIAYLVSEYPALSHTFITTEIEELERRGHEIMPISVRRPSRQFAPGSALGKELQRTFFLLPSVAKRFPRAFLALGLRNPLGLLKMVKTTLQIARKASAGLVTVLAYFAEAAVLCDWMRANKLKHLHNHFGNAAAFPAMIAASSGELSYSLSVHGPDVFYNVDGEMLKEKVEGAAFVRCIGDFCRSQLCLVSDSTVWDRIELVRCGVDTERFHPRARRKNVEGTTLPMLLCVGRLVAAKGQNVLLRASAQLHQRGLPHTLTIVGTGPDEEGLKANAEVIGIAEHVKFTGGLPPAEVHQHFSHADLFVLPSFAEGIPVVLMEAMAMEIPVISTAIAGIPELIEDRVSGRIVPPASVNALTDAIGDYLVQPTAWDQATRRGRAKVKADFDQAKNADAMVRLFEKHLAS